MMDRSSRSDLEPDRTAAHPRLRQFERRSPDAQFGGSDRPAMRLLLHHDDKEREFAYTSGAERVLQEASGQGWTVVSMRDDWKRMFGRASGPQRRVSGPRPVGGDRRVSESEVHFT
jgi:hypothetical protein